MKLKSVTIDSYKNLKGTYSFENNSGYIALIGLNGSGKTNLLEAISIIFDKLINQSGKDIKFDYQIEYEINGHTYTRKKGEALKDGKKCPADQIEYPTSLIACYSGEDLRLWRLAYENYHMGYFSNAVKKSYSSPRLIYVNRSCWEIAFVALVCSSNVEVKDFLQRVFKINSALDVEIDFVTDENKKSIFNAHSALNWFNRVTAEGLNNINLNMIASTDIYVDGVQIPDHKKAQYIFNYLYLLSQPEKTVDKKSVNKKQENEKIKKNNIDKLINGIQIRFGTDKIEFNNLSEGEKKLILIECVTKVLGDENALILLDEPDAHTHVAMKKDLLKLISSFSGQTILTTHSPLFLNKRWDDYKDTNVFYINNGKIETTEPLKHLAELTGGEIDYFEGSFLLSSKKILVTEGPYDILYLKHAIDKLSSDNPDFMKLKDQVAFIHAGGADNAVELYRQSLLPSRNHYDKLIFLFDYDKSGYEGSEAVMKLKNENADDKTEILFYQSDYAVVLTRKPNDKDSETYMAEDLFHSDSYKVVTDKIHVASHKELRNLTWNDIMTSNKRPKGTTEAIKYYIQDNYSSFEKDWLQNFKPVLEKLMEMFNL